MCGIYGVWRQDGSALSLEHVQISTRLLTHRGPDDEGYLVADTRGDVLAAFAGRDSDPAISLPLLESQAGRHFDLALGFRRLSIVDLSPAGHQPMGSADGRRWIVFNGEIYNHRELRSELSGLGYRFRTSSDTEVILAAVDCWGEGAVAHFNGMWAFAIWDAGDRSLFLSRDRFGVKPLYFTASRDRFAFASEIKALVGPHGIPFAPRDAAVYDYLIAGYLPEPDGLETFFAGVQSLPPGHNLRVTADGRREIRRFYSLPVVEREHDDGTSSSEKLTEEYRELLIDSVRLRLRADVPVGTCLSGGLDSSSIVGIISRLQRERSATDAVGERLRTFSAVYDSDGPYNERRHIDTVLAASGAEPHFVVPTSERLRADLERLVWYQEEPFQTTSMYAQWCVMSIVRGAGVTVLLDGQGADEALAGYQPFDVHVAELLRRGALGSAVTELASAQRVTGVSGWRVGARALAWQLPEGVLRRMQRQRHRRAVGPVRADFAEQHLAATRAPVSRRLLDSHLREVFCRTSLPHLLRYEDRNSMAHSVEARVPFLDYRLIDFTFRRASRQRIQRGWTKWILRNAVRDFVPPSIVWRRDKVGFATPQKDLLRAWIQANRGFFDERAASAAYVDPRRAQATMDQWVHADSDGSDHIWRLINLELWLRVWQAAATPAGMTTTAPALRAS